jgi:methionyl-tRNA formyltransferase
VASNMPTIVFFGNERIATGVSTTAPTLRALITAGYRVACLVIAQGDSGQSRKQRKLEVLDIAEQYNIPVVMPEKLTDIAEQLASYKADAGVLVAFGKLVPQSIIDLFPAGIINIHPSLLPLHRGSIPLESALLQGDKTTGVSLMGLVSKMDAGPIYAQAGIELEGSETKQVLADRLINLGSALLLQTLPDLISGNCKPVEQDDSNATYDTRINKDSAVLSQNDWAQPATTIERMVRAYAGWPRVRTRIGSTDVIIISAHINLESEGGTPGSLYLEHNKLGVHTAEGVLIIDTLLPLGKKEMAGAAFIAGYKPSL